MSQEATQGVLLRGADGKHYFIPHTDLSRYALEGTAETGGQLEAGAPRVTAFAVQQTGAPRQPRRSCRCRRTARPRTCRCPRASPWPQAVAPATAQKVHFEGTHRTVEPARTLARLLSLLPSVGITRVGVITGLDVIGIPVVMVCRPNGRSLSVSQGKGVDLTAAKVSGIMEAVEAWHAENVLLPLRLASYRELRALARVVDVSELPRPALSRFHRDLSILWIEGTDVFTGSGSGCRTSRCTSTSGCRRPREAAASCERHRPRGGQQPAGGREPRALRGRGA